MSQCWATIIAAIIVGVVGPIITILVKRCLTQKKYPNYSQDRLDRLLGVWKGHYVQKGEDNSEMKVNIEAHLKHKGKIIKGDLLTVDDRNLFEKLIIDNGYFDGNLIKVEYSNEKAYIFQKGSAVMEMSAKGDNIKGKFVGYSPIHKDIISGNVILDNKID